MQHVVLRRATLGLLPRGLAARGLAKKAPISAAPQKASAPAGLADVVSGLNILKDGADPKIRPDAEYPEWVWTLCAPTSAPPMLARALHSHRRPSRAQAHSATKL